MGARSRRQGDGGGGGGVGGDGRWNAGGGCNGCDGGSVRGALGNWMKVWRMIVMQFFVVYSCMVISDKSW